MNKRKLFSVALTLCMVAILAIGGTLAYFTDNDNRDNIFTVGNVDIELEENFTNTEPLKPGSVDVNNVTKEVYVENVGSEKAYVRVHIAIPSILDNAQPDFDASKNVLHFNAQKGTYVDGQWNWSKTKEGNDSLTAESNTMIGAGAQWNHYNCNIEGINYNVYVVTYESELAAKTGVTTHAMNNVYLDAGTTNEDITKIKEVLGDEWKIKIFAEGVQSAGFTDAYHAFASAYKAVGTYQPWGEKGALDL